jgi:hypothetical protein
MQPIPSLGGSSCLAAQEIPNILRDPKVRYRVRNSPPLVPILSQINPAHILPSHFLKIHFNISLRTTLRYSKFSLL